MKTAIKFIIERLLFIIDILMVFCLLNTILDGLIIRPRAWLYWGRDGIVYTSLAYGYLLFIPFLISLLLAEFITKKRFKDSIYLIYGLFIAILYYIELHEIHLINNDLIWFYLLIFLPFIGMITLRIDKTLVIYSLSFIVILYSFMISTKYIFNDSDNMVYRWISSLIFVGWPVMLFLITLPIFLIKKSKNKSSNYNLNQILK